jgi:hypothetical protein
LAHRYILRVRSAAVWRPGGESPSTERDYIRRELDIFFSTLPCVARVFSSRPGAAVPTLASRSCLPIAKGLIARGLMRLDASGYLPRLYFTKTGLTALPPPRRSEKVRSCP